MFLYVYWRAFVSAYLYALLSCSFLPSFVLVCCIVLEQIKWWWWWWCEAGGLTRRSQVGANPIPIPHPTNLALFGRKITLYRFNQGLILIAGGSNRSRALSPLAPLAFTTVLDLTRGWFSTAERAPADDPIYFQRNWVNDNDKGIDRRLKSILPDLDLGRFVTKSTFNFHCAHLQCYVPAAWHFANPYRTRFSEVTVLYWLLLAVPHVLHRWIKDDSIQPFTLH